VPRFVIGSVLGPVALGLYAFVMRLQYAIVETFLSPPISVLYPAFATIKHDKKEQQKIAGKILFFTCMILFPILALATATAPIYVPLFFGKKWSDAVILLQIYLVGVAAWPLGIIVRQIYRAHGKNALFLKLNVFVVLMSLSLMSLLFLKDGLMLFAIGSVIIGFVAQPVYLHFLRQWSNIELWRPILHVLPPAFSALLACGSIYLLRASMGENTVSAWGQLTLTVALGLLVYLATVVLLQYRQISELIAFANKNLIKKKSVFLDEGTMQGSDNVDGV
jgi:O-antigen/teichoic acid export membrane protein